MASFGAYSTGTASVASGSKTVTLTGGYTTTLLSGDPFYAGNGFGLIDTITDDTHFELSLPWNGTSIANVEYLVAYLSVTRYQNAYGAKQVRDLITLLDSVGLIYYVPDGQSVPDVSIGEEGQYAIKIVPGAAWTFWVKQSGVWVNLGSPIGIAWKAAWSSATTYGVNDIVARNGILYLAIAPSTNAPPETNPAKWQVLLQGGNRYDLAWDASDRPDSGETFRRFVYSVAVQYNAGLTESRASALIGATATTVFSIQRNGVEFGTLTFAASGKTVTTSIASPGVVTDTAHGLVANAAVAFTSTGRLPTGLSPSTVYYVCATGLTSNSYRVSLTPGGAAIDTSGSQVGTHTRFTTQKGVFASPSIATAVIDDVVTIVAPSPRDETLSSIAITLTGYR